MIYYIGLLLSIAASMFLFFTFEPIMGATWSNWLSFVPYIFWILFAVMEYMKIE